MEFHWIKKGIFKKQLRIVWQFHSLARSLFQVIIIRFIEKMSYIGKMSYFWKLSQFKSNQTETLFIPFVLFLLEKAIKIMK